MQLALALGAASHSEYSRSITTSTRRCCTADRCACFRCLDGHGFWSCAAAAAAHDSRAGVGGGCLLLLGRLGCCGWRCIDAQLGLELGNLVREVRDFLIALTNHDLGTQGRLTFAVLVARLQQRLVVRLQLSLLGLPSSCAFRCIALCLQFVFLGLDGLDTLVLDVGKFRLELGDACVGLGKQALEFCDARLQCLIRRLLLE